MAARRAVNQVPPLVSHQALYGYDDGHRLLAASFEMSSDDRRLLQRQTDTPDAGLDAEWSELLAGYPLPSGRYAWTMTWPAPEMRRPGCVWTHVVFFDDQTIDQHDPGPPLDSFRRPRGPDPDIGPYRTSLHLANPDPGNSHRSSSPCWPLWRGRSSNHRRDQFDSDGWLSATRRDTACSRCHGE